MPGPCGNPETTGGQDPPPWKITKLGFLSNIGPDPLKNHKATKSAFNVGQSSASQRRVGPPLAKLSRSARVVSIAEQAYLSLTWSYTRELTR